MRKERVSNMGELGVIFAIIQVLSIDVKLLKEDGRRMRYEVARLNDSFRWFVGITVTVYVGLIGVIITLLLHGVI